jgi:hypothetical protein
VKQHRVQEFGVLPLYVGYLFETEEPGASPTRDFPRIRLYEARKNI